MENDPPSLSSSSSHPNDQLLKEFLEITGSSYQDAQAILESTNYNLENALNLYLEVQPTSSSSAPYAYDPM